MKYLFDQSSSTNICNNGFIKITIQRNDEKQILFIGSNVIEFRGEIFSFSDVYKILRYI